MSNVNSNFLSLLKDMTLMVVEDDEVALFGLRQALKPCCAKFLESGNGLEALEIYKQHINIDVLISDINLPGLNAFEMIECVLKINPNQKIIIMTSYPTDRNLMNSFKIDGVCLFLRKPINILDLQTQLALLAKKPHNNQEIYLTNRLKVIKHKEQIFLDNKLLILTGINNKVFWLLFNNLNNVVSYETLEDRIYGIKENAIPTLRMAIVRLKKQLQDDGIIINIQDTGYMLKSQDNI